MEAFTFTYPKKVYFGHGVAAQALWQELAKVGRTVMLAPTAAARSSAAASTTS